MTGLRTTSSLPPLLRAVAGAVMLLVVVCVAGVLGDGEAEADINDSASNIEEVTDLIRSPRLASYGTYGVGTPWIPTAHLFPIGHRGGSSIGPFIPRSQALSSVTQVPVAFQSSGNLFTNYGVAAFTPAPIHASSNGYNKHSGACPRYTKCVPLVVCSPIFSKIEHQSYSLTCPLYSGAAGVCCPDIGGQAKKINVFSEPLITVRRMSFSNDILAEAETSGVWQLEQRDKLEQTLRQNRIEVTNPRLPEYAHLQFFRTSPLAIKISRKALIQAGAGDYLATRFRLSTLESSYGLQQVSLRGSRIEDTCPRQPNCGQRERFYRTIDGSCNNLDNPLLGQARTPFMRITPPRYSDGLMRPRISVTGQELPSARLVSTSVIPDADIPDTDLTLFVMLWGQFIDHDLTHTPIFRLANNSGIMCCRNEGLVDPSVIHPACFPIIIPADDYYHAPRTRRRCMNFVRSMVAPRGCNLGYAEQMNQITHHLDGSNIYGSSREEEQQLRAFTGGLLRANNGLLPPDLTTMLCSVNDLPCFMAGDNRVNEQIQLTVMHTLWVRFHNVIASELGRLNPHWDDETIFQEARRIVVAIYQHIIFNEWLPIILGPQCMAEKGLLPLRNGYSDLYDPSVSPVIANEFATAAFRFGHTLVQGMLDLIGKGGTQTDRLDLVDHFNNPSLIYTPGKLGDFLRGLATQPPQRLDNFVSSALTNRLFEGDDPFGMDLVALNTQRGRDHAIGTYNDLREVCGLPRARTFEDFLDVLPAEVVAGLARIYASPDDVEPFVAGISEAHVPGALLGPTFKCIISDQFARLRRSDRFFYDLGGMPSSFTPAQLDQIRRTSFARVLCLAGENVKSIQPLALRAPRGINERVSCDNPAIPPLDLSAWSSSSGSYHRYT